MKQTYILTIAVLLAIAMISGASAAGVVVPYLKDDTLKVYPGDSTSVSFTLQNGGASTQSVTFKASITKGSDIASLKGGDTYFVPANGEIPVTINLNIPSNAAVGTQYPLTVSFATVTSGTGTGVNLGIGMEASLNVLVVAPTAPEKPAPVMPDTTLIAVAIVILALFLWIIFGRTKKRK